MTEARASFPPELTSAMEARRFSDEVLDEWGLTEARDTVRLLVSELVINAVRHAGTEVALCLRRDAGGLLIEVSDGSTAPPVVRSPTRNTPTGRGLQIVEHLSDEWGVHVGPNGKTVWFALTQVRTAGIPGGRRACP
jgi:anti-sigma regulatory factor (Ser/Thr protein kinase)